MKKLLTAIIAGIMAFACVFSMTACGWDGGNSGGDTSVNVDKDAMKKAYGDWTGKTLEVYALDKGIGTDWVKDAVRKFNAGTGARITSKADETLNESLSVLLDARSGADVYFSFASQLQWVQWAKQGKILSLDDIGFNYKEATEKVGIIDGVRYTMPYTFAPTGIIYNQNYINEIPSNGEFVTGTFPTTWQGLLDMCDSVNEKWNKTALGQKVVPMSYGGSVGDIKGFFYGVWAQIDPVGFKNYWEQTTTSVAGESNKNLLVNDGVIKAVDSVAKLLNAKKNEQGNYYPSNAFADSTSHSNLIAEQKFLNGLSVFTLSASWFETEMKEHIEDGGYDFYRFAPTPKVNVDNPTAVYVNSPAEFFMVAANGKNKNPQLAKAFLKYMATEERCQVFHSITGTPAALQYRVNTSSLSRFAKEVVEATEGATLAIAASDQIASLTGAINLDANSVFKTIATTEYTPTLARTMVESMYKKQVESWNDYMKSFNE